LKRCIDVESQTIFGMNLYWNSVKEKLGLDPELGQGGATWPARDEIWRGKKK
jgi:hypothetical protein